jgi:hypothetical protein
MPAEPDWDELLRLTSERDDARRERDEAQQLESEELKSEQRWARTYQDKVIELERQLAAANKALVWVEDHRLEDYETRVGPVESALVSARAAEGTKT